MSNNTSANSSQVIKQPFLITLYRQFLTNPTIRSNCPPHQGARLLNCHLISWLVRKSWSFSSGITIFIQRAAPTNIRPLSEKIFSGPPRLAINRFKLGRNSLVWTLLSMAFLPVIYNNIETYLLIIDVLSVVESLMEQDLQVSRMNEQNFIKLICSMSCNATPA